MEMIGFMKFWNDSFVLFLGRIAGFVRNLGLVCSSFKDEYQQGEESYSNKVKSYAQTRE
jgi:hypothetical protein